MKREGCPGIEYRNATIKNEGSKKWFSWAWTRGETIFKWKVWSSELTQEGSSLFEWWKAHEFGSKTQTHKDVIMNVNSNSLLLSSGAHSFVLLTICSCRHSKRQFLDAQTQGKEAYENNWSPKEKQEKVKN